MTGTDRMVVWLRATMDAAEVIARSHQHPCGEWEYDHIAGEIRDHCNAGTVAFVGKDDPAGEHMALHDPAAVLRRIAADRKLLDDVLAEPHFRNEEDNWYSCAALTDEAGEPVCLNDTRAPGPCDCGRDARVQRRVRLLAEGWGWIEVPS